MVYNPEESSVCTVCLDQIDLQRRRLNFLICITVRSINYYKNVNIRGEFVIFVVYKNEFKLNCTGVVC